LFDASGPVNQSDVLNSRPERPRGDRVRAEAAPVPVGAGARGVEQGPGVALLAARHVRAEDADPGRERERQQRQERDERAHEGGRHQHRDAAEDQ
jgi:hypothetical protein